MLMGSVPLAYALGGLTMGQLCAVVLLGGADRLRRRGVSVVCCRRGLVALMLLRTCHSLRDRPCAANGSSMEVSNSESTVRSQKPMGTDTGSSTGRRYGGGFVAVIG